jgi:hypothetical protein
MVHFIEVQAENSMIFSGEHWRTPTIALFVCCQRAVFLHGEKNFPVVIEKGAFERLAGAYSNAASTASSSSE